MINSIFFLINYDEIKKYRDNSCSGSIKLRPQQYLLSNYINPNTPYKGLILFHGTGTGKTCATITIAENFKDLIIKYNTKIYILVPGPIIKNNWIKYIFLSKIACTRFLNYPILSRWLIQRE